MRLLYICTYNFVIKDGVPYTIAAYSDRFWDQFTDVFEGVDVVGEPFKDDFDESQLLPIKRNDVTVQIAAAMARPSEFFNGSKARPVLEDAIKECDCVLVKIISRKANLAIQLAKKYKKPYMIGMTGDLYRTLKTSKSIIKKMYAPLIYYQSLWCIRNCKFGTYVTQDYLQKVYPIKGKMCGFTDTIIPKVDEEALRNRIERITKLDGNKNIYMGVIGAYHTNNKGHDTIIQAMEMLDNPKLYLRILGVGVEEDQKRWIDYGKLHNVHNIIFDEPVVGVEKVFNWLDNIDICLLPSRSEGLPRSIIEAISRACPCITSNVCGMPELVNNHWLHEPEDFKTLGALISEMLNSPQLMLHTAKENFEHSKEYTLDNITRRRNEFFTEFKEFAQIVKEKV